MISEALAWPVFGGGGAAFIAALFGLTGADSAHNHPEKRRKKLGHPDDCLCCD